jgi:membrane peptidoglycan carboxypeptidase
MHPAMQRRRHRLMTRRTLSRRAPRRGIAAFFTASVVLFAIIVGGSIVGAAGTGVAVYSTVRASLPDGHLLDGIEMPASTYVYDRTGKVLLARFECQNREQVRFSELPEDIVNATVAAEDRTFWENDGVDWYAVVRAAVANWRAGRVVQGASTITQQVIKYAGSIKLAEEANRPERTSAPSAELDPGASEQDAAAEAEVCKEPDLTFLDGRTMWDKFREAVMAQKVTDAYPGREGKEKILETYLNLIYYGNGSYGIAAAAANYFGISDLHELTLSQAAFLAGLPQRPSDYDPYQPEGEPRGPESAMARRDDVLRAMHHNRYITRRQMRRAMAVSWQEMRPSRITSILREPHFSFRVQREAERILASQGVADPAEAVRTGGYRITTTLDYGLQQSAKRQVKRWVAALVDKNVHNGALVAIDSATGEIVAYVGSVDYYAGRDDDRIQGQFDVAGLARRQPGSAFKPIVYSTAFRSREATPATFFVDNTTQFGPVRETSYMPTNADIQNHGPLLAMDALRYSLNVPSVMMQFLAGVDATAEFAESMGVASKKYILDQDPGLTLGLGSVPVNLTNLTGAYGVFAQEGVLRPPTAILEIRDRNNRVVYSLDENGPKPSRPLTREEAYLTHWIIRGNTDPKLNVLWGPRARIVDENGEPREAGFKTGTTNDFRDVSGFGYVPGGLVTGVWMGNNNLEPMSDELGQGLFSADGPLYLWHDFMEIALNRKWDWNDKKPVPQSTFEEPEGIVTAEVCRFSGMAATEDCGETIEMPFLDGTVPPPDNVHSTGCFDIVQEVQDDPRRPIEWVQAAQDWADRYVSGQTGAIGDPTELKEHPGYRLAITPVLGNTGFGGSICGRILIPLPPEETPEPTSSGPEPSSPTGPPEPTCKPRPHCTPQPRQTVGPERQEGTAATSLDGAALVPAFAITALIGLVPLTARAFAGVRRRRRR